MTLTVLAGTPGSGTEPGVRAGDLDLDAVTGEWEVQWLLPFLWMGLVPDTWWAAHCERLLAALDAGEDESPDLTDVVVSWPVAEAAFRSRLDAVLRVWPEVRAPAERFIGDVASVAERTSDPAIRLQLDQLVTASWGDPTELGQYASDVLLDADQWDAPRRSDDGRMSELHRAVAADEPERTFLLAGEWTYGGSPAPGDEPAPLPEPARPALHDARADARGATPRVPRPSWIDERQWAARYGVHGEDLWEIAAERSGATTSVWPWHWAVVIAVVFAVVTWLVVGMFSDSMVWAVVGGVVVLVGVLALWGRAAARARRAERAADRAAVQTRRA